MNPREREIVAWAKASARPLHGGAGLDELVARIGDARYVLLGEATHGTAEFYVWRARLSARLIEEHGFSFVAVEGDWPDCLTVNNYVKDRPNAGASARAVLHAFSRWPTWMWANKEVVAFAEYLREVNRARGGKPGAGFYGLDVYSLWESLGEVIRYLERIDPPAVKHARTAAACFDSFGDDLEAYARASALVPVSCEDDLARLLVELQAKRAQYREDDAEAYFAAEQNALVARNAERYYRSMLRWGAASWNVRDRHMVETLERLMAFHGPRAKCIVWAHNTHVGDARATDMAGGGYVNVGQLLREAHPVGDVFALGFATHRGGVIAGPSWESPMERMAVPPAQAGSLEDLLYQAAKGDRWFTFADAPAALAAPLGHRAIGVVYDPVYERGNYVPSVLPDRYDALAFIEHSHPLHPLHIEPHADTHDAPETFPTGE